MNDTQDARAVAERQTAEYLAQVRQAMANGFTLEFEETLEDPLESGVSYWGKAVVELVGAYAKDGTIAVLAWFKQFDFPDRAINEFWNKLCEQLSKELVKRIPDLKWSHLRVYFFDSLERLEKAALQGEELSGPNGGGT